MRFIAVGEFEPPRAALRRKLERECNEHNGENAPPRLFQCRRYSLVLSHVLNSSSSYKPVRSLARSRAISSSLGFSLVRSLARQNVPLTFMKRGHNIRGKSVKVNQLSLSELKPEPPFSLLRPFSQR